MTKRTCSPLRAGFVCSVFLLTFGRPACAQNQVAEFKDFQSYVQWIQSNHKAPFDRDGALMPEGGAQALLKGQAEARARAAVVAAPAKTPAPKNIQVNQDRNPWPKAEIAAAIDPTEGTNWVVLTHTIQDGQIVKLLGQIEVSIASWRRALR